MDNGTKRLVTSLPDERELQVEKSRDSTPALAIPCMSPSIHYRIMSGQACSTRTSEDLDDPDCDAQGYSDFQVCLIDAQCTGGMYGVKRRFPSIRAKL